MNFGGHVPVAATKVRLVEQARQRARQRGLPFDLTVEGLHWPETCPVFGMGLDYTYVGEVRTGRRRNTPSLDRRDNDRGYTLDNTVVISFHANMTKNKWGYEGLLRRAEQSPEKAPLFKALANYVRYGPTGLYGLDDLV